MGEKNIMNSVTITEKLNTWQGNTDFDLYKYHLDLSKNFDNEVTAFETYINCIKEISDKMMDFSWLVEMSNTLGCYRKDIKTFCTDLCASFGEKIEDLSRHSTTPLITKPSGLDTCPFAREDLVLYGPAKFETIRIDGKPCKIIDTKIESNDLFSITINRLDR